MAEQQYIIQEENSEEEPPATTEEVQETLDPTAAMPPVLDGLLDASEAPTLQ